MPKTGGHDSELFLSRQNFSLPNQTSLSLLSLSLLFSLFNCIIIYHRRFPYLLHHHYRYLRIITTLKPTFSILHRIAQQSIALHCIALANYINCASKPTENPTDM